MLSIFQDFRNLLDEKMVQYIHRRVVLIGGGYSGRFLKWYADYYHSICVDYQVSLDMKTGQSYEEKIFRLSLFDFNYKDVDNSVVWISEPLEQQDKQYLKSKGFSVENGNFVDFYMLCKESGMCTKTIQFMEVLEKQFDCDFVKAIETKDFSVDSLHSHAYRCTTQKEIFPILDKCHCIPGRDDAIFDYGCGKGGALISFLDYGFLKVGGVEYEPRIFDICKRNIEKLHCNENVQLFIGDAVDINEELDLFNWFFFFQPFDNYIFSGCIESIHRSYKRKPRKIRVISISPSSNKLFTDSGVFRLTNQFTVDMRQRVVDIYETY